MFIGGNVYGDVNVHQPPHAAGPLRNEHQGIGTPREVTGYPARPSRRRRNAFVAAAAIAALVSAYVWWSRQPGTVQIQGRAWSGCWGYYTQEPPTQALADETKAKWGPWPGGTLAAGDASASMPPTLEITAQTSSQESVILTGIRITSLVREPLPKSGITISQGGCGAGMDQRPFKVDLDRTPATLTPEQGSLPPTRFPYRIESIDPEVFTLDLSVTQSQCWFTVEVSWVNAGKAGSTIISDAGKPFHVIGGKWPAYMPGGGPGAKDGLISAY